MHGLLKTDKRRTDATKMCRPINRLNCLRYKTLFRLKCTAGPEANAPFTRSSKHRADIEQTSSEHRAGSSS